ncbi:glycosyltransferase [Vibrio breoganii]
MKISLLLVTYNRLELLKKALNNIELFANGISELIIVDNFSNDGTSKYLKEKFTLTESDERFETVVAKSDLLEGNFIDGVKVKYIRLHDNTGGSGGFHEGMSYFSTKSSCEWVWGMDDDAFVQENSLDNLKTAIQEHPNNYAFASNCNSDTNFIENYKSVNNWMFVGFCVKRDLVNKVGLPVSDYFIYHDDSEYAERIIRYGYEIIKVKNSIIEHGDLSQREFWHKEILGLKLSHPSMSEWKLYYYLRNDIHKVSYNSIRKIKRIVKVGISVIELMIVNPNCSRIALMAIFHGLIGKKGKVIAP